MGVVKDIVVCNPPEIVGAIRCASVMGTAALMPVRNAENVLYPRLRQVMLLPMFLPDRPVSVQLM